MTLCRYLFNDRENLHIDVGGGSTELNLYHNRKKIASRSFKIGSVRKLENMDTPESWLEMEEWIKCHVNKKFNELIAIGTGQYQQDF